MGALDTRRGAATAAVAGSFLLLTGTLLHPMSADPNDPIAAFAEYAADRWWVASHLMQLGGVTLIVASLVLLAKILGRGRRGGEAWAELGKAAAVASLATAAALQAVDGVALKAMVNRWAAANEPEKQMVFQAAVAVRQVEIGLASMVSLLFGLTAATFGAALRADAGFPRWLAWLGLTGGAGLLVAGALMASTGFSAAAMNASMPATILLLAWLVGVGVRLWVPAD
jgi:hypothetical protein